MTDTTGGRRILVLGAGYSGMMCAIRVARRSRRQGGRVTLVNPSARFTERLRMHQIATGQRLADHRIPELLDGTGVDFVEGRAAGVDPERREVRVETGAGTVTLPYDILVYAIGAATDTRAVPGAASHAYTFDGAGEAGRLAKRLAEIEPLGGAVTVCGGGLTGIEAATEIAESHPGVRVVLVSRDVPGAMMGDRARRHLDRALERLGIEVRAGAEVVKVLPDAVELAGGELLHSDACLLTAGVRVAPLAADAGITVDERGRIVVDGTLRSVSHPQVHAVGDAAAIRQTWGNIHGTCQSGIPTAAYTADAIVALLRGRRVKPFRFGYVHQPVSLGRRDAVIQFTHPDDTPRRWILTGRAAVVYKEFVSGSPVPTYRLTKRYAGALVWPRGGRRTRRPVTP
ncbi:NAD(P)/FAD-dependent oxidoreductase [Actinomadura sp. HBU206391]|uniref:NAD(P)/FAD-dependent oxidoreductase n=1 Tax=Actinomadura sp. HBU206391 TaxID=2731692 RepID=UPI00165093D6|nr:FAD-dependent oxidoreductase [Actinomadura sp. HBU206391]MBC6462595.1 FAD-dependent oxidoreductase [Actinomadura sp. HBU206391]